MLMGVDHPGVQQYSIIRGYAQVGVWWRFIGTALFELWAISTNTPSSSFLTEWSWHIILSIRSNTLGTQLLSLDTPADTAGLLRLLTKVGSLWWQHPLIMINKQHSVTCVSHVRWLNNNYSLTISFLFPSVLRSVKKYLSSVWVCGMNGFEDDGDDDIVMNQVGGLTFNE